MSLSNHTLILKNNGTLWGCGRNDYGQLGLGDESNRTTLTQIISNINDVKSVYCGYTHTLILKNNGTLWGCGRNDYGQLGLGDTNSRSTPALIGINTNDIKSVYCGHDYTLILKNNGTLWGCGKNDYGQLGLGDTTNRSTFTLIGINTNDIKSVYCGGNYTIILKNDGTLWGCGRNDYGQLGLGDTANRSTFTIIGVNTNNVKSICCGYYHTFMLKNDSTLCVCGRNDYGQLGLGQNTTYKTTFTQITTNTNDIESVYCGYYYTLILKNDGTLWSCGDNGFGQLGLGDTDHRYTFVQIITNTNNIKSIYCGSSYILILKNDGTLWGCGWNVRGPLGLGDTNSRKTFTQITTNVDNIESFANNYNVLSMIKIYDLKIGYTETLDTNNFRNIPVDKFEKLKVLYTKPLSTILNCIVSFDKKQTWKTFDGLNWNIVSDSSESNIITNCMEIGVLNTLNKNQLIAGGFTGDLDFKIVMKTNDKTVTSSVTKIYIEYK